MPSFKLGEVRIKVFPRQVRGNHYPIVAGDILDHSKDKKLSPSIEHGEREPCSIRGFDSFALFGYPFFSDIIFDIFFLKDTNGGVILAFSYVIVLIVTYFCMEFVSQFSRCQKK